MHVYWPWHHNTPHTVFGGSHPALCGISLKTRRHQPHNPGRSLSQVKMDISVHYQNHQGTLCSHTYHVTTSWYNPRRIQSTLHVYRRHYVNTHAAGWHLHNTIGMEVVERLHATLPTHTRPRINLGHCSIHGPLWGLCTHTTCPQVLAPCLLKDIPLKALSWGKFGVLAQNLWGFFN